MQRLRGWSLSLGVACLLLAAPGFINAQAGTATAKKSGGKTAPTTAVDINNASQSDLEKVPGIGTSTAKKIVAGRPYSSVADLSKAGLSAKQIQTLTPMLTAAPAAATAAAKVPPVKMAPVTPPAAAAPATLAPAALPPAASKAATSKSASNPVATPGQTCAAGQVWVNTETKVYHMSGDKYFGNTKHGKCMVEADAQKAGYHASKQKMN